MPGPIGFNPAWGLSPLLRELPFDTIDDFLVLIPEYLREDENVVRDAIAASLIKMFAKFCSDHVDFASGTDEVYATSDQLDYLAKGVAARQLNEGDESFQSRLLVGQGGNSPAEILAAVKAIIAPFTSVDPYYYELPDDGIFLSRMSVGGVGSGAKVILAVDGSLSGDFDGFYFAQGEEPIVASARRYFARGDQTRPRWAFLEGKYRGAPSPFTNGPSYVRVLSPISGDGSYDSDDYRDVFSGWGKAIIGIPPFPFPGVGDPAAPVLVARGSSGGFVPTLLDASGALTLAALESDGLPPLMSHASVLAEEDVAAYLESANANAALVVDSINAMLNDRLEWGCKVEILLDPLLV
jgi:hypothetical protein